MIKNPPPPPLKDKSLSGKDALNDKDAFLRPVEDAIKALRNSLSIIEARAAELDANGLFPTDDMHLLYRIGLLQAFAGDVATPLELMETLRLLGRANLSVGRIFEGHVNGLKLVERYGTGAQLIKLKDDLNLGKVYGVWNTEPGTGVTIVQDESGPGLKGLKSFATGAGHIHRAIITGRMANGDRRMIVADVGDDPTRADNSGWRVRGMRATASGTYDFSGIRVAQHDFLGNPGDYEREPYFSAGAWRFTAVQLGGIEQVLTLLRHDLLTSQAGKSPVHRSRFGRALASSRSAFMWVREAAVRAEADNAGSAEVSFVLMTRGVVEHAALEVMEAAARSIGTRAFFFDNPVDRACRDLGLYLRQPVPDEALDKASRAFIERDCWRGDPIW